MNLLSFFEKSKFLMALPSYARLIVRLYRDERVPLWLKLGGVAGAALIVSPLDPFADIPILGMLDDVGLIMLASRLFFMLVPGDVLAEHRAAVGLDKAGVAIKNVTPR